MYQHLQVTVYKSSVPHMLRLFSFIVVAFFVFACKQNGEKKPQEGDWIKGPEDVQLKTIEKHFRGLDNAMIEIGYRYQELYWAGEDENWEYAKYQADKIELAMKLALERRPKRAASAEQFMNFIVPQMKTAIESKDNTVFKTSFQLLTTNCNTCHEAEKVPFFTVKIPDQRFSPIRK